MLDVYAVRMKADHQLVCYSAVHPILGESGLSALVDEFTTVKHCEYARLESFSIGWPGKVPSFAELVTGKANRANSDLVPSFSEEMQADASGLRWSEFGSGYVYFLRSGSHMKIGFSSDVKARVTKLQTGNPERISFIGARPGSPDDEARIHDVFAEYRDTGEWFTNGIRLARSMGLLEQHNGFHTKLDHVRLPIRYELDH